MRQGEIVSAALGSLCSNPVRSLLTAFGVTVGVTAVVVLVGVVSGIGGFVQQQFENMLSARAFSISRHNPGFHDAESMAKSRSWPPLTYSEAEALAECVTTAAAVSWRGNASGTVIRHGLSAGDVMIQGLSPSHEEVSGSDIAAGRFFNWAEDESCSRVCILGSGVTEALELTSDSIGVSVLIEGHRFTVIGLNEAAGSVMGRSLDDNVSVPFNTFRNLFARPDTDVRITVLPAEGVEMEACQEEATQVLRRLRGLASEEDDNFYIVTQESALSSINELLSGVAAVTIGIAAISLLVGGIGIMNITLVSVAERTTEIGTRRALGATRGNVVVQFLAEAVMVSTIGGLIGLLLGILVVFGVNRLTPLPAVISGWSVTAALGFSGVVGLLFGVFPAWKASRLVPMEALRHE
jgi:putative ABC transport system permease protein